MTEGQKKFTKDCLQCLEHLKCEALIDKEKAKKSYYKSIKDKNYPHDPAWEMNTILDGFASLIDKNRQIDEVEYQNEKLKKQNERLVDRIKLNEKGIIKLQNSLKDREEAFNNLEKLYSKKLKETQDQSIRHYEEKFKKLEEKLAACQQNVSQADDNEIQEPAGMVTNTFLFKGLLFPTKHSI